MSAKNNKKTWSEEDVEQLKKEIKGNTPTGLIAYHLQRSENSIKSKASRLGLSLKPTNKSPYDRKVSLAKKARR